MHELAVAQGVIDTIVDRLGDARVTAVHLQIGQVCGVLPDALRFCFDLVAEGTPVEGARLQISEPAGEARCRTCGTEFTCTGLILLCDCGSADVELHRGHELLISAVEVA